MKVNIDGLPDSLQPVGVSELGTVVSDNVVFPAGSFLDLDGNLQTYEEVKLDAVVLSVNRAKNIVISNISGRDGSFKEYITNSDYEISLTAIIAPPTLSAEQFLQIGAAAIPSVQEISGALGLVAINEPVELLERISALENIPERVAIRSKFLSNNFAINFVVISSFDLSKETADSYSLKLDLLSDFEIDLNDFG